MKIYLKCEGPWKKKNLAEFGIVTQCIAPTRVNDQYLTNVLLKINAKVFLLLLWFLLLYYRLGICHQKFPFVLRLNDFIPL